MTHILRRQLKKEIVGRIRRSRRERKNRRRNTKKEKGGDRNE